MVFRKNSSQGRHSVEWRKKNSYFGKDEGAHHRSGEKMDHLFWDEGTFLRLCFPASAGILSRNVQVGIA